MGVAHKRRLIHQSMTLKIVEVAGGKALLRGADCAHAQCGISQIDHTHSWVMRSNPLVCIYPSASPRDNRKLVGYIGA